MKFLGVELGQFACFERQFLRMQPWTQPLRRKNNSGNTAILRPKRDIDRLDVPASA
jgi:hypothetical protein